MSCIAKPEYTMIELPREDLPRHEGAMIERLEQEEGIGLVLTPNRSLSWPGNLVIWGAFSLLVLTIAIGMALAGAWVVLPFAGLEILALLAALYYTSRQCHRQEVLLLTAETLRLEKGIRYKQAEWELPRRWVRLSITMPRRPWRTPELELVHRDTEVSLASFLNREDTRALVAFLERQGIHVERREPDGIVWF